MLDYRESREQWEWENLAPYSSHSSDPTLCWRRSEADPEVRGADPIISSRPDRSFPKRTSQISHSGDLAGSLSRFRTAFQIDIERITNSTAFRRLEYKTQVFVTHEGDNYRTRLTHIIEVSETSRTIGQVLRLNEDLIEAIALGHDLGHTPCGHEGEEALSNMFKQHADGKIPKAPTRWGEFGAAFYHNVQGVRVVDKLERGYEWDRRPHSDGTRFDPPLSRRGWGLDLTWATREGILKHSSRGLKADQTRMYGSEYLMSELDPFVPATLEGQVVEYGDELASMMHDLEDGMRYRLFSLDDLQDGLMRHIREDNLSELLGIQAHGAARMNKVLSSRVHKLRELFATIQSKKDRTVGTMLALLRTILLSNIIETTSYRLQQSMQGFNPINVTELPKPGAALPNEFLEVGINLGPQQDLPMPTASSYCPEAWELKAKVERRVKMTQHDTRSSEPQDQVEEEPDEIQLCWEPNSPNPEYRRYVHVYWKGKPFRSYPLEQIRIRHTGCKLAKYGNEVLALRDWLRKEFIPAYIHHSPMVDRMNKKGKKYIDEIFNHFMKYPFSMHSDSLRRFGIRQPNPDDPKFVLRIAEHLQGMTDRYLERLYARLFIPGSYGMELDEVSLVDGDMPPQAE